MTFVLLKTTQHKGNGVSLGRLHMGRGRNLSPHMVGTCVGGQIVNGITHNGGHRPYGGRDLTLIDYIIN